MVVMAELEVGVELEAKVAVEAAAEVVDMVHTLEINPLNKKLAVEAQVGTQAEHLMDPLVGELLAVEVEI